MKYRITLVLLFINSVVLGQFNFINTGEMAIYNEQIWQIEKTSITVEKNKLKNELFHDALNWGKKLVLEDKRWDIISESDQSILFKGYFDFLYIKNGLVSRFPALITFELLFEDKKLTFNLIELTTRYSAKVLDSNYAYDVTEFTESILTLRPFKKKGRKIKKANDYEKMKRVEYYLNSYFESLSNSIG
jgi:hypothetical protein